MPDMLLKRLTLPYFASTTLTGEVVSPVRKPDSSTKMLTTIGDLRSPTALSACLTKITGIFDKRIINPNLFTFITARASAGKDRLTFCRNLIDLIHDELRQLN